MTKTEYLQLTQSLGQRAHRVLRKYDSKIGPAEMVFFFETIYTQQLLIFTIADTTLRYDIPNPQPGWRAFVFRCGWTVMGMKYLMRSFIRRKRDEMLSLRKGSGAAPGL